MSNDAVVEDVAAASTAMTEKVADSMSRQEEWISMQQMKQLVRVCCLEVMGAAPAQLEHYKQEVRELQSLVSDFRKEVAELKSMRTAGSDDGLSAADAAGVDGGRASHPPAAPSAGAAEGPPLTLGGGALGGGVAAAGAAAGSVQRIYIELDGAPIQSWYENRPMPPISVKLVDDKSPPSLFTDASELTLRISLCNGRGLAEERTANGAQDLLVGEREVKVVDGRATFQNLRVMEISQKHYGSFQLAIAPVGAPAGLAIQPLRTKQFVVQVGRMWSKRRKSEDELQPDDPISQIPGVGKQYVSRLQVQGITEIRQFAQLCSTEEGKAMLQRMFKGDKLKNSLNDAKFNQMVEQANKVMVHASAEALASRAGGAKRIRTPAGAPAPSGYPPQPPQPQPHQPHQPPQPQPPPAGSSMMAHPPMPPAHMLAQSQSAGAEAHAQQSRPLYPQHLPPYFAREQHEHPAAPPGVGMTSGHGSPHQHDQHDDHGPARSDEASGDSGVHSAGSPHYASDRHDTSGSVTPVHRAELATPAVRPHAAVLPGSDQLSMDEIMTLFAEDGGAHHRGAIALGGGGAPHDGADAPPVYRGRAPPTLLPAGSRGTPAPIQVRTAGGADGSLATPREVSMVGSDDSGAPPPPPPLPRGLSTEQMLAAACIGAPHGTAGAFPSGTGDSELAGVGPLLDAFDVDSLTIDGALDATEGPLVRSAAGGVRAPFTPAPVEVGGSAIVEADDTVGTPPSRQPISVEALKNKVAQPSPGARHGMAALQELLHALPAAPDKSARAAAQPEPAGARAPRAAPRAAPHSASSEDTSVAPKPAGGARPFAQMSDAHVAAWHGDPEALLAALRRSSATDTERSGCTVLDAAALGGDAQCVEILLKLSARGGGGDEAARAAQPDASKQRAAERASGAALLPPRPRLERAGSSAGVGGLPLPPLHVCIASGRRSAGVVRALLSGGHAVNERAASGLSPLHICAHVGDVPIARELLAAGADVNQRELKRGLRPAHFAAIGGHAAVLELLLAAPGGLPFDEGPAEKPAPAQSDGAPPRSPRSPLSLLLCAAVSHSQACVRIALRHQPVRSVRSALAACAVSGAAECLQLLLAEGAASPRASAAVAADGAPRLVDTHDADGITLLMLAALHAHEACVGVLLEHGASVDRRATGAQWGVLHFAAAAGDDAVPITEQLLAAGADAALESADGATAVQLADLLGHSAMQRVLSAATASRA